MPDSDFEVVRRAWAAASGDHHVVAVPCGAAMEGKAYRGPEQAVAWLRDQILVSWELLVEVRGGKVACWRTYTDRDEARRDAGLEG